MTTTFSVSHTLALDPKFFLNTPMVPGPQTSWVIRTSTFTQTLSAGATDGRPAARARIFSVMVIAAIWQFFLIPDGGIPSFYGSLDLGPIEVRVLDDPEHVPKRVQDARHLDPPADVHDVIADGGPQFP